MRCFIKKNYQEIGSFCLEEYDRAKIIIKDMDKYLSFVEKLTYLLGDDGLNLNNNVVSKLCLLDTHTIKNYKENKTTPDEKNLMRICCGLQLNPLISRYLFFYARKNLFLIFEQPYPLYGFILEYLYFVEIEEINKLISSVYPDKSEYLL